MEVRQEEGEREGHVIHRAMNGVERIGYCRGAKGALIRRAYEGRRGLRRVNRSCIVTVPEKKPQIYS